MGQQIMDDRLYALMSSAVREGLGQIDRLLAQGESIGGYVNRPSMSYTSQGLPAFHDEPNSAPDYRWAFSRAFSEPPVNPETLPMFVELLGYAESHERLHSYFMPGTRRIDPALFRQWVFSLPARLVDRYIQIYDTFTFSDERFLPVYLMIESGLLHDVLRADFVVPILFLKFKAPSITLAKGISIETMDDELQLARMAAMNQESGITRSVVGSASHALIVRDVPVSNSNFWDNQHRANDFPTSIADVFFAALRIVCQAETGYAQLLIHPRDWAHGWNGNLPAVEGVLVKAYPSAFENYQWLEPVPSITGDSVPAIVAVFSALMKALGSKNKADRRLLLASHRVNRCFLRKDKEDVDAVLDATIGMEALLSDGTTQEVTHKLSMRMAALSKLASTGLSPLEVLDDAGRVYGYRSAIVHGNVDFEKKRKAIRINGEEKTADDLAVDLLCMAMNVLIQNPKYLDAKAIDKELLLGTT